MTDWGRCDNCRWWTEPTGDSLAAYERGKQGWGLCARLEQPGALAEPSAADDWEALLLTSPGFGCVQWEAEGHKRLCDVNLYAGADELYAGADDGSDTCNLGCLDEAE